MQNSFKIEPNKGRVFGLDVLRAFAIICVLIRHGGFLLPDHWSKYTQLVAFDGVAIFFVLSGYLIGTILIKNFTEHGINKSTLSSFWIRRWFRTLPAYFLVLSALSLYHLLYKEDVTFKTAYKYFIFSQNIFRPHPSWFFPEAWSLSIEEWFYLMVPLLTLSIAIIKKTAVKKTVLIVALVIILSVTLFRFYRYLTGEVATMDAWDLQFRKQVVTQLDSLMFGVLGAYTHFYYQPIWVKHKRVLLIAGLFLILCCQFIFPAIRQISSLYYSVFSFSVYSLAVLFTLPYLSEWKNGRGPFFRWVTYTSLVSYSLYLINLSIVVFGLVPKIPWHNISNKPEVIALLKYGFFWLSSFLLSGLLYRYFELPMTRLRDSERVKNFLQKIR